jgi:predicted dienelactone hydrolase
VGYLVVLTKDIRTGLGTAVQADRDFARLKLARSSCGRILDSKTRNACEAVDNQLHFAQQLGVSPDRVALTFSFSTEAPLDTLRALANPKITAAQAIEVVNTGLTTQALNPALPGHATLYKGTMQVAYYGARPSTANPTAPLTASWHGQSSSALTRFNPIPETTETLSIPLLITVPNTAAMPANGWPVVIFQHGLTRNRLDAIAIADTFADAGYVVASIDLALHGVTDSSNPFFDAPNERTFNLDLVNNATSTAGPDGEIDPTGTHFINLASLRTTRDNLRQSAVDLLTLVRTLPNLNLGTHAAQDIDPTRIHFIGHSLGGIVGGVLLGTASRTEISTGELANAGGEIVRTIFDSPAFGAQLKRILAAQGIQDGTRAFAEYVRDAQGIIDAGDPLNYIAAATQRPLLLLQVSGDQVVLNNATQRLVDTANLPRICDVGDNLSSQGFVSFVAGAHGSLLDPSSNLAVTVEMQTESVVFARSLGRMVRITDPSVVQPDCAMKR